MYTASVAYIGYKCIYTTTYFVFFTINTSVKCDTLEDPANGAVTVTGLYQGSTATYTCDNSYELGGDNMRTCDASGMWTNVEPTCARKHLIFLSMKDIWVCMRLHS